MASPSKPPPTVAVLGAGNMGSALAHTLAVRGHRVAVWDHFEEVVKDIREKHENPRYLPGVRLHQDIRACDSPGECVEGAPLVILCVPSAFTTRMLEPLLPRLHPEAVLLNVAKGFAPDERSTMPAMIGRLAPDHRCVHLAGPAIADEFARGHPAFVVMASSSEPAARQVAEAFAGDVFHPTVTTDVTGAALGGILKNIYAILLGCLDRMDGGTRNLEASVITACVHEMVEIGAALGGERATLLGLAGLGDLVATGFSEDSHNRSFGRALGSGKTVAQLEDQLGALPEGVRATRATLALAGENDVPAPLAGWVGEILAGEAASLDQLLNALRPAAPTIRPRD